MNIITLKNFNLGGIADSDLQGPGNSLAEIVGCDIHSEPGFLKVNQKLTKESDSLVDDLIKAIVPCSDGLTYLFGSTNGKIWKRDSSGVYTLLYTATPAAGGVGIIEAKEYQGYIYYAMESRLGRVAISAPTDWSARDDDYATFGNTDADFHPMKIVNQILYVGDAADVAQVNEGTFSASALDIKTPLRVKALGTILTDLLLGTFVTVINVATEILRWNTWSGSYSVADEIPEVGINAFLATDNFILVNAGEKGNIYSYDGQNLHNYKRIPGDWSGALTALVHPNATVNKFGLPLFGVSNLSGNPTEQGIYSLGRYDRNYPDVLNFEWVVSRETTEDLDIGAIELIGTDLIASWKNQPTVTITIADPAAITLAGHKLVDGDPVSFATTGALPTGITAGAIYFAKDYTDDSFHIYDTAANAVSGGATGRVVSTGTQSGVHTASIWGVDVLDTSNKITTAYFVTKLINVVRNEGKLFGAYVGYRSLPGNTTIKIYQKANHATSWTEIETIVDTENKIVVCKETSPKGNAVQFKVELNSNGDDAPEIELFELSFE